MTSPGATSTYMPDMSPLAARIQKHPVRERGMSRSPESASRVGSTSVSVFPISTGPHSQVVDAASREPPMRVTSSLPSPLKKTSPTTTALKSAQVSEKVSFAWARFRRASHTANRMNGCPRTTVAISKSPNSPMSNSMMICGWWRAQQEWTALKGSVHPLVRTSVGRADQRRARSAFRCSGLLGGTPCFSVQLPSSAERFIGVLMRHSHFGFFLCDRDQELEEGGDLLRTPRRAHPVVQDQSVRVDADTEVWNW